MSNNRKKRKYRLKLFKSKTNRNHKSNNCNDEDNSSLKVVNGRKRKNKIIKIITGALIAVIIILLILINYTLPTGIIESLQNAYAAMGDGTYPVNVYAANSSYFSLRNDMVCALNDSFFELYNKNGKLLHSISHGMSKPHLEESEARYLLYDRDRYKLAIYNYSGLLFATQFEKSIVSADISRSGSYAVVTASDSYQNTVTVFNKENELLFTWNSANYYITDVAVNDDGDSIALCLLESRDGSFNSYVYILTFDSADPKYKYTFSDIVSSLSSVGENYILANGFNKAFTIPWNGGAECDLSVNGIIRNYDYDFSGKSCLSFGREDNEQVNEVTVLDEFGNTTATFKFDNIINDIAINESRVAVLSNNTVYIFDMNGNSISSYTTESKGLFVGVFNDGKTIVLDRTKLSLAE